MVVIYIDRVFFLNAWADYLLLLLTARLAGLPLRRRRYFLAGLGGGAYAAAALLPGWGWLAAPAAVLAAGALLALAAYGGAGHLGRLTLLFFAVSCAFAGCVLALGQLARTALSGSWGRFFGAGVLLAGAAAVSLAAGAVLHAAARHHANGALLPVRVCLGGRVRELTALYDSGNALRDGDTPVLVAARGSLDELLPAAVCPLLTARHLSAPAEVLETLAALAPELRPHLVPYRAVGVEGGLLLTVESEWTEIQGRRQLRGRIALAPTALGEGYSALWGGAVSETRRAAL